MHLRQQAKLDNKIILCRVELAAQNVRLAALKLSWLVRKYDSSQPRIPAGSPGGGQWSTTGGAGDNRTVST